MDTSDAFVKKLFDETDEVVNALQNGDFYIEIILLAIALALAWLVSVLVNRRVAAHLKAHPPKRIDSAFILKPLSLLGPFMAMIYLGVMKPFITQYAPDGVLIDPLIQLCFAYLIAKAVVLILRGKPVSYFIAGVIMIVAILNASGFMKSTTDYLGSVAFNVGTVKISLLNIVQGAVCLVIVFWLAGILSRTLESYLRKSSSLSYNARELMVKFFSIFIYLTAFLITLSAIGVDLTIFAVFGGALGVGIGLGLQKITANFVSGITLLLEKSIQIGDLIDTGQTSGWVRQLNVRYTLIETANGSEVLVPNEELMSTRVTNWTHSNMRARIDIPISVAYGTDPELVTALAIAAAREDSRCLKDPAPSCFLREFTEHGLKFLLIMWVGDVRDGRYGPQHNVMMALLKKFQENDIKIPSPQQDIRITSFPKEALQAT